MFHEWQKAILALQKAVPPERKTEDTAEVREPLTQTQEAEESPNGD